MSKKLGRPSLVWSLTEGMRLQIEFGISLLGREALVGVTNDGRGKPVLVIPGFGGADYTSKPLRSFLNEKGYASYGWGAGMNTGPNKKDLTHLKNLLADIYERHGKQKVAIIGHSLGGIYARELAREFPDMVEQVITLCTPFSAGMEPDFAAPGVRGIFQAINGHDNALLGNPAMVRQMGAPPPVPTTSLYTRHDGVVNWRACLNPVSKTTENMEILASHCGMIWNPGALVVIGDRLQQDLSKGPKSWTPFIPFQYNSAFFRQVQAHYGLEPKLDKPAANDPCKPKLFG